MKPHAADFFVHRSIRRNDKFVYLLYTSPSRGQVLIYPSRWNPALDRAVEEIVKLIRGFKDDIEPVILG